VDFLRIVVMEGAGVAIREEGQDPGMVNDHRSGSLSPRVGERENVSENISISPGTERVNLGTYPK
jgi:hypothetical protein